MNNPFISINLLLYRPGFYLKPCLESVLNQSYKNFELLIIDNNSSDGTAEKVKEIITQIQAVGQNVPPSRIIVNQKNLGFAAAHNFGINDSRGELVFLLNQDIILDIDFLKKAVLAFGQDEKIGSLQGKLLRLKIDDEKLTKTDIIDNAGLIIFKNRRVIARGQGQADRGQFDGQKEIFGVDGAAPIYRRAALQTIKICLDGQCEYLDEDFYMYKEDVDLAWRLRLAGWQAYYEPRAMAWHARTAGDSAAVNYFGMIKERLKINKFAKYLSFKNQRLMQIKNEQPVLLFEHLLWFLPKEIASWIYVILFERYTWKAIRDLFRQAPRAWQKREVIMVQKKVSAKEMEKWFE